MIAAWAISGVQLLLLMKTLPKDEDAMEAELARYAKEQINLCRRREEDDSLISIEERMTSFDGTAAKETLKYVRQGIREIRPPFDACATEEETSSPEDGVLPTSERAQNRTRWIQAQLNGGKSHGEWPRLDVEASESAGDNHPTESTGLLA